MAAICRLGSGYSDRRGFDTSRCREALDPRRSANRMDSHRSPESCSSFPCSERKSLITCKGKNCRFYSVEEFKESVVIEK